MPEEQKLSAMACITEAGYCVEFVSAPLNDDDAKIMATVMAGSIQPYEE